MQSTHSTCEHAYVHFAVLCCAVQGRAGQGVDYAESINMSSCQEGRLRCSHSVGRIRCGGLHATLADSHKWKLKQLAGTHSLNMLWWIAYNFGRQSQVEATTTWLVLDQLAGTHSFRHLEFLQLQCFLELPLLGLFLPRCLHKHYALDC